MKVARKAVLLAAVAALSSPVAFGANRFWDGTINNNWTHGPNWDGGLPVAADVAFFDNLGSVARNVVILDATQTVSGMEIDGVPPPGVYEFQRLGAATLTVTGSLDLGSNGLGVTPVTFNGFHASAGGVNVNVGTLNLTGGAQLTSPGDFNINEDGVLNIASASAMGGLVVNSNGVVNLNSGGSFTENIALFLSSATARVNINDGGALVLNASTDLNGGTLTLNSGGTLNLAGGDLDTDGPAHVQLNRSFNLPGGRSMFIDAGGHLVSTSFVDIGSGGAGTLLVSGLGSSLSAGGGPVTQTNWATTGGTANITISDSATADYNAGLTIGSFGGSAIVNLMSAGHLNVDQSLFVGGAGTASITINGGRLTSTGPAAVRNATVALQAGTLNLGGNATFTSGGFLNWTGGTLELAANSTFAVQGAAINLGLPYTVPNGGTLRITSGGNVQSSSNLLVGSGVNSGTLLVEGLPGEGGNSQIFVAENLEWGGSPGSKANVTFSNSGLGTFGGSLNIGASGGAATVNIQSSAQVHTVGLVAGPIGPSDGVQINVNGGTLHVSNLADLADGVTVNYSAGSIGIGGPLFMAGNAKVLLTSGGNKVLRSGELNMSGTSKIDLADNDMIIDYTIDNPAADVRGFIITGRNGGNWLGNRMTSSTAAGTPGTRALGYADNSVLNLTSFSGQTVDATTILVKHTYLGDTNLDGQVDITDLGKLATAWQTSGVWTSGDFDYSNFIDITDLGMLATNWQAGVGSPLGPSFNEALASVGLSSAAVPEPAIGVICGLIFASLPRRRRR